MVRSNGALMKTELYSYFDEAYFQRGEERGTAYHNYKEGARNSPTFREIASAIREVFQPRRVLEIGCATGNIVRHLNEIGCEAHGIDVSEWAVRNAEHRNVKLASADDLPYPDAYFDLVISCHSLEHLPDSIFDRAISEISRVASRFQFHMLPIVGIAPYEGDPAEVRRLLRKDPTHQQLHDLEWWLQQFRRHGHIPVETALLFKHDTTTVELSTCQFVLAKGPLVDVSEVGHRAMARNQRIFRAIQLEGGRQSTTQVATTGVGRLSYENRMWKDFECRLQGGESVDLSGRTFQLVVIVNGKRCNLRFAAGEDLPGHAYAHVGEFHLSAQPGCNLFSFATDQLRTLRGQPNYSRINHLALGGENENAEIVFYFCDQTGRPVLS
jgi:SAM-dependent methyltransferase